MADIQEKDKTAAAHDLTVIAERWPDSLSQYSDVAIAYLFNGGGYTPAEPQAQFDLLRQLYAAHWTMQCGVEPSFYWRKFVQELVDRGDLKLAQDVVTHIRAPKDVLILRVDRRYTTIAAADTSLPTVEQAAVQDIEEARAAVQRCPQSMSEVVRLLNAMLTAGGHDEDVLQTADECLDQLARRPHSYEDAFSYLNWVLNDRAYALIALGRWAEAERAYQLAVSVNESGRPNVSQRLNFAQFLIGMGRVNDAVFVVGSHITVNFRADRIEGVSQYGAMVFASAKLQEALRSNDHAAEDLIFAYIKKHRGSSESIYRNALLRTHRTDEYAQALIEDIRDPLRRADTLVALQHFKDMPKPPGSIDLGPETKAAMDRPDIQQAIREVGSLQSFDLPGHFY